MLKVSINYTLVEHIKTVVSTVGRTRSIEVTLGGPSHDTYGNVRIYAANRR